MASLESSEISLDYSIGFDNVLFSDRTLLLHIKDDNHLVTDVPPPPPPRVIKTVHINSLILAGRSPFFLKLFSNGMRESEQERVTIQIEASEEVLFMDLLKYIYSNDLPNSLFALLNLLKIADKFEVPPCLKDCSRSLQNFPMTIKLALIYLDLPTSLLMCPALQPLISAAEDVERDRSSSLAVNRGKRMTKPPAHHKYYYYVL